MMSGLIEQSKARSRGPERYTGQLWARSNCERHEFLFFFSLTCDLTVSNFNPPQLRPAK
jgi:hypothetical protein